MKEDKFVDKWDWAPIIHLQFNKRDYLVKMKQELAVWPGQILLADGLSYTRRRKDEVQRLTC